MRSEPVIVKRHAEGEGIDELGHVSGDHQTNKDQTCEVDTNWMEPLLAKADTWTEDQHVQIPNIIWMYWAQGLDKAPVLVQNCIASWVHHNPSWRVVVLDDSSIFQFIPEWTPKKWHSVYPLAHRGDILRVTLMR